MCRFFSITLFLFFSWPWIFRPFGSTWMGIFYFNYKLCDGHGAHWTYKHQPASHNSFTKSIYSQCTQPRSSTNKHTDDGIFFSPFNGGYPHQRTNKNKVQDHSTFHSSSYPNGEGAEIHFSFRMYTFHLSQVICTKTVQWESIL